VLACGSMSKPFPLDDALLDRASLRPSKTQQGQKRSEGAYAHQDPADRVKIQCDHDICDDFPYRGAKVTVRRLHPLPEGRAIARQDRAQGYGQRAAYTNR
jgi:hypothetical protein